MTKYTSKLAQKGVLDKLSELDNIHKQGKSRQRTILVIEDSSVIQNMIRRVLEFQHYEVTTAKDGRKALSLCEQNNYDLILMDLAMPILGGVACLKAIRAMEDRRKATTPVIAVTGNSEAYTPKEFMQAGFNAFHQKPIDFDELSKLILEFIAGTNN